MTLISGFKKAPPSDVILTLYDSRDKSSLFYVIFLSYNYFYFIFRRGKRMEEGERGSHDS
jgi:hypothetical protein